MPARLAGPRSPAKYTTKIQPTTYACIVHSAKTPLTQPAKPHTMGKSTETRMAYKSKVSDEELEAARKGKFKFGARTAKTVSREMMGRDGTDPTGKTGLTPFEREQAASRSGSGFLGPLLAPKKRKDRDKAK